MTDRPKHLKRSSLIPLLLVLAIGFAGVSCSTQKIQTVDVETEANEILDVLLSHGIRSRKVEVGDGDKRVYEIHISGGEAEYQAAIQLMDDHCLPQPVPPAIEGTGIVSSMGVEKSRELRRIKINTESLLRKIPGATVSM